MTDSKAEVGQWHRAGDGCLCNCTDGGHDSCKPGLKAAEDLVLALQARLTAAEEMLVVWSRRTLLSSAEETQEGAAPQ